MQYQVTHNPQVSCTEIGTMGAKVRERKTKQAVRFQLATKSSSRAIKVVA